MNNTKSKKSTGTVLRHNHFVWMEFGDHNMVDTEDKDIDEKPTLELLQWVIDSN